MDTFAHNQQLSDSFKEIDMDYLQDDSSKYPFLRDKTDNELIEIIRASKDTDDEKAKDVGRAALNFFIANNKSVIDWHVKVMVDKYPENMGFDTDDLYQAGRIALFDALDRFDISRGTMFKTYASERIDKAIREEINASIDNIRIPENIRNAIRKIARYKRAHPEHPASEVKKYMIADGVINSEKLFNAAEYYRALSRTLPMYRPADGDSDYINEELIEVCDNQTESPEDYAIRTNIESTISKVLSALPEDQRKVAEMLNGFTDGKVYSVSEVAKELNVSVTKVAAIKSDVFSKLGKLLKELR